MRPTEGWFFSWVGVTFAVIVFWVLARFGCSLIPGPQRCYQVVGSLSVLQWPLIGLLQMLLLLRFRRDAWQWALAIAVAGLIGSGLDYLSWTLPALGRMEAIQRSVPRGGPLGMAGLWIWQWGMSLIHYLVIGLAGTLVLAGWRWGARAWMVGMILLGALVTPASLIVFVAATATGGSGVGPFSSVMGLVSGLIVCLMVSFGTALAIAETMRRTPMQTPAPPPPPMPVWR